MSDQKKRHNVFAGCLLFIFSLVSYALFSAGLILFVAFVGGWANHIYLPVSMPLWQLPTENISGLLAFNVLLFLVFGAHHSVTARKSAKKRIAAFVGDAGIRIFYVFSSSVLLIAVMLLWQPVSDTAWQIENSAARTAFWLLHGLGWITVVLSTFLLDHFDFTGLRQGWNALTGRLQTPAFTVFRTPFLYRIVRHPLMTGLLLAVWCVPTMTLSGLMLALVMTGYIFVGVKFEEKDLIDEFGDTYRSYMQQTPGVIPFAGGDRTPPHK